MIDIVVCGACGRMGGLIVKEVLSNKDLNLVGAIAEDDDPNLSRDTGIITGTGKTGVSITPTSELSRLLEKRGNAVMMDFTNPEATVAHVKASFGFAVNTVIGTTGFNDEQLGAIKKLVKENGASSVLSPNFSVGMNVYWEVSKFLAQNLGDYDVEIVEAHHRMKKDSPSGTAKKIATIVSNGKEVPTHSIRAGDIAGDHVLLFAGAGERIELTHRAQSRVCFASGAIHAARWVANKRDGKVHSMKDVLGI